MSESPAPDLLQSGQSTPGGAIDTTSQSQSQTPKQQQSAPPGPAIPSTSTQSLLDKLSPEELKKRLEEHRKSLRASLEKKRKLDRDLVRIHSTLSTLTLSRTDTL